jgi:hypothetical protein
MFRDFFLLVFSLPIKIGSCYTSNLSYLDIEGPRRATGVSHLVPWPRMLLLDYLLPQVNYWSQWSDITDLRYLGIC